MFVASIAIRNNLRLLSNGNRTQSQRSRDRRGSSNPSLLTETDQRGEKSDKGSNNTLKNLLQRLFQLIFQHSTSVKKSQSHDSHRFARNESIGALIDPHPTNADSSTDISKESTNSNEYISRFYITVRSLSRDGPFYQTWQILGLALTISLLFDIFISTLNTRFTYLTHPLTDIYFMIDIIIRFNTQYIDRQTGELVTDLKRIRYRYLTSWFIFDLILSIPYGFLRHCWESRPALKLLALKEQRPLHSTFQFFKNKEFRKQILSTIKAHVNESNFMRKIVQGNKAIIIPEAVKQSRVRKAARMTISWYRAMSNLGTLKVYSSLVTSFMSVVMSIRTLSLLSSKRRQ